MPFPARDAVVYELVARSRSQGGAWTVGLAGVLLPGLRRAAWSLAQACPGKAADIEAEMLATLLAEVASCEAGPAPAGRPADVAGPDRRQAPAARRAGRARPP